MIIYALSLSKGSSTGSGHQSSQASRERRYCVSESETDQVGTMIRREGDVFAYIVRRLLWAVVLLIVLSMVTFSIFYLVPRSAGRRRKRSRPVTWGGPPPRRPST